MADHLSFVRVIMARHARSARITVDELVGSRRFAVSRVRQDVWLELHEDGHMSTTEIGLLFGRDHSTVVVGIGKARARAEADTPPPKYCHQCGEDKPANQFHAMRGAANGLHQHCRDCRREERQELRNANVRYRRDTATTQTSMWMSTVVVNALRRTAADRGETQSGLIERAVRRELHRMWTTCTRCQEQPHIRGSELCGSCIAAASRERTSA